MEFRQQSDLSRDLNRVLTDMMEGRSVSFRFASEAQLGHVLSVLQEVAESRQVVVQVQPVDQRTLELTLEEILASAPI